MTAPDQLPPGPSSADAAVGGAPHVNSAYGGSANSNGEIDASGAAGPSRRRTRAEDDGNTTPRRPASPQAALSRHESPAREITPHLDLANYPTPTLLRMLASLLQQIASANDQLRAEQDEEAAGGAQEVMQQDPPPADNVSATGSTRSSLAHPSPTTELFHDQPPQADLAAGDRLFTASKVSLSHPSSILSFHARHVPSISIEAYLLRILKYCPTTNEVFLGLLVYFDRMSKLGTPAGVGGTSAAVGPRGFAIDSYNVHRLIIAGVTVASKFFSDVFYTNSRYAKVGGLPPHELNQLELQFLLLNNFTLMIPPEEMQKYGDRLLVYWRSHEHESGVEIPESKHRREQRDDRRETRCAAPKQPDAQQPPPTSATVPSSAHHTPIAQASSTAPTTPNTQPAQQLSRSSSLPRHPPSTEPPVVPRSGQRERPTVSFPSSGLAQAAPVASGF